MDDQEWMQQALQMASRARDRGEIPVGALVVRDGVLLGAGHNLRQVRRDPLAHAEIVALRRAARRLGDWRLEGCAVYVTLEPCPMCVGALLAARVSRLIYAASNPQAGAAGSVINLADYPGMKNRIRVRSGVLEEQATRLLGEFFDELRGR
ncbi:MAG TPA: tRNA adenosine(34) deaminase TadA [Candidatus Nitrosotenuis sp.]|jgi:tRNA(adenine34) deaminase|nr:tRNA adenosine(34) deaminase TadA [Candidatus Nitrosotenuis sp.]